jgi:hypothetical protein
MARRSLLIAFLAAAFLCLAPAAFASHLQLVSTDSFGLVTAGTSGYPSLTPDGRYVAFDTELALSPDDTNALEDVYVKDLQSGQTTLVSRADGTGFVSQDGSSYQASISADGRYVAFNTGAHDLTNPPLPRTRGVGHVLVRDLMLGTTTLVDQAQDGTIGLRSMFLDTISPDGRYVLIGGQAQLDPQDIETRSNDVYMKDLQTGALTRISANADGSSFESGGTVYADITTDDSKVVFATGARVLPADNNAGSDVYVKDLASGDFTLVSQDRDGRASEGDLNPYNNQNSISADGRYVVFSSPSMNVVRFDTTNNTETFVRDLVAGTMQRVAVPFAGGESNATNDDEAGISDDGRFVVFASNATNMDASPAFGIFVRKLSTNRIVRVSLNDDGVASQYAFHPVINGDGLVIAFDANSPLLPADTNGAYDVYAAFQALVPPVAPGPGLTPPGGNTASGANDASPEAPVVAAFYTPAAAQVTFTSSSNPAPPPGGYSFFGTQMQIETGGVTATAASPFQISFVIDATLLGATAPADVQVFRDGVAIADCTTTDGSATPDPCVRDRGLANGGDARVLVLTSHASRWNFGTSTTPSDTTAPVITPTILGTLGTNGWYTSDASLSWLVSDAESAITTQTGCTSASVTADTIGQSFTCAATSGGGSSSQTVTIKRDATKPTVTYSAHPAVYTVDQQVSFTCTAADAAPGSGLATQTCADTNAPAYSFGLGQKTLSATATDQAGLSGSGQTQFTVTATSTSVCALSLRLVEASPAYQALKVKEKGNRAKAVETLCEQLLKVKGENAKQWAAKVKVYSLGVDELAKLGFLTPAQATLLKGFANAL